MTRPEIERLAILETKQAAMEQQLQSMDGKLDSLLALRDKGAGAFLLAASLFGSGIIGGVTLAWKWLTT